MGNSLKKPTPAEVYAENVLKINKKTYNQSENKQSVLNSLKIYYEQIQFLKNNPEKIKNKNILIYLSNIIQSLQYDGIKQIPIIDVQIENEWKTNYDNYIKSDEYKKDQEKDRLRIEKYEAERRESILKQRINDLKKEIIGLQFYGKFNEKENLESTLSELESQLSQLKQTQFGRKHTKRSSFGKWSKKYKRSINCKKPKGFSQKQYCNHGRKK
jgi:hypothetical protein